ncbi:hypothetical protein DFP72DRAFT_1073812 [Ephemerocybe angulata]|uniref:Uncharacterized protein n=1 Tax=Ephemerocybe angulata TaxID=980116 RepID=A0A8H6HNG1_9AGAR|nr:hypothetical protein DFP72DRAFT_1073812 [Tulosesus angulatus]
MASSSTVPSKVVLLHYGDDPFKHKFVDLQGADAFTMYKSSSMILIARGFNSTRAVAANAHAQRLTDQLPPSLPPALQIPSDDPNKIVRLMREDTWAKQYPNTVMGPDKSHFFFGAEERPGVLEYGNNGIRIPMEYLLRAGKKEGSISRYFRAQSGKEFKWKVISTHRMECQDLKHTTLAVWEVSPPDEENFGRLTLRPAALQMVTEILSTLTLNRMAQALGW